MRLLIVLLSLCALAAAAPSADNAELLAPKDIHSTEVDSRNILVNGLVRQLIAFIRRIINNGWDVFGIPPLDPLEIDHMKINVPAELINLSLELEDVVATGFGSFVTHRSNMVIRDLTLELDIRVPQLDIRAAKYDFIGNLFNAIPLYGKGGAVFEVTDFRFRAKLFLKQSDNGQSVIIDKIEEVSYEIPSFKSNLSGVIGGGDIDAIVNAIVEEVIIGYVNRFQGAIGLVASRGVVFALNPFLNQLDTWRYIAPFV